MEKLMCTHIESMLRRSECFWNTSESLVLEIEIRCKTTYACFQLFYTAPSSWIWIMRTDICWLVCSHFLHALLLKVSFWPMQSTNWTALKRSIFSQSEDHFNNLRNILCDGKLPCMLKVHFIFKCTADYEQLGWLMHFCMLMH